MAIRFYLKYLLERKNITQKELSEKTGIRLPTISAICNNNIKQFPVTAMNLICDYLDCTPGDFIDFVKDGINVEKLNDEEYNNLLLSKPLVGGIYKIKTSLIPYISEYYKNEYLKCIVIGNSIEFPEVTRSVIIPISPKIKATHLPTHYIFKYDNTDFMAMGESYITLDNKNLDNLLDIVGLDDFIRIQNTANIQSGIIFSSQEIEIIKEQKSNYFKHIEKYRDLFLKQV